MTVNVRLDGFTYSIVAEPLLELPPLESTTVTENEYVLAVEELTVNVFVAPDVVTVNGVSTELTVRPDGVELTENEFMVELPESVDIVTVTVLVVPASAVVASKLGSLTVTAANAGEIKNSVDNIQNTANRKAFIIQSFP
jgi:hypothetical protein